MQHGCQLFSSYSQPWGVPVILCLSVNIGVLDTYSKAYVSSGHSQLPRTSPLKCLGKGYRKIKIHKPKTTKKDYEFDEFESLSGLVSLASNQNKNVDRSNDISGFRSRQTLFSLIIHRTISFSGSCSKLLNCILLPNFISILLPNNTNETNMFCICFKWLEK